MLKMPFQKNKYLCSCVKLSSLLYYIRNLTEYATDLDDSNTDLVKIIDHEK